MINTKFKDGKMINADIIKPGFVYAEFKEGVSESVQKEIEIQTRYGGQMIHIFGANGGNRHISSIAEMIGKMEAVMRNYNAELYAARK